MKSTDNGNTSELSLFVKSALFTHSEDVFPADPRITNNLFLVHKIAMRVQSSMATYVDLGSLIDAGRRGLIDAASSFNSASQLDFASYVKHRIQGAILDYLRCANQTSSAQPEPHDKTFARGFELTTATHPEKNVVALAPASVAAVRIPV